MASAYAVVMSDVDDALWGIHEYLWDPVHRLCRLARGAMGGRDLSAKNLHPIRDSALGAVVDFDHGNDLRGNTALREVLAHQYDAPDRPWHGTFKVIAEDRTPQWPGAEQWRHYDPNWRQFLGCILAFITLRYPDRLDGDVRAGIDAAIERCVIGEPEDRIPDWYTNPNVMHAWLAAHVGLTSGDADLLAAGERRRAMLMERLRAFGDVDEYNSPTYDGVDVMAALMWIVYPPSEAFLIDGEFLAATLLRRMETLYHPALGVTSGPYSRAYGMWLNEYVSLTGVLLRALDVQGPVLPAELNAETDHIHDLYFWPMLRELVSAAPQLTPLTPLTFHPRALARSHIQVFGTAVATSVIGPHYCVGFENGRQVSFARDQYVPVAVHYIDGAGVGAGADATQVVAVMLSDTDLEVDSDLLAPTHLVVNLCTVQPDTTVKFQLITRAELRGIAVDMEQTPVSSVSAVTSGAAPQAAVIATTVAFDVAHVRMHITWPEE
jgi:hypothetical protein